LDWKEMTDDQKAGFIRSYTFTRTQEGEPCLPVWKDDDKFAIWMHSLKNVGRVLKPLVKDSLEFQGFTLQKQSEGNRHNLHWKTPLAVGVGGEKRRFSLEERAQQIENRTFEYDRLGRPILPTRRNPKNDELDGYLSKLRESNHVVSPRLVRPLMEKGFRLSSIGNQWKLDLSSVGTVRAENLPSARAETSAMGQEQAGPSASPVPATTALPNAPATHSTRPSTVSAGSQWPAPADLPGQEYIHYVGEGYSLWGWVPAGGQSSAPADLPEQDIRLQGEDTDHSLISMIEQWQRLDAVMGGAAPEPLPGFDYGEAAGYTSVPVGRNPEVRQYSTATAAAFVPAASVAHPGEGARVSRSSAPGTAASSSWGGVPHQGAAGARPGRGGR
jgi:hypothetical protein